MARDFSPVVSPSILDFLPGFVANAIKEYADTNGLSAAQVVELALAQFLDLDAVTFDTCNLSSPGQMKERIQILEAQLQAHSQSEGEGDPEKSTSVPNEAND